MSIRETIIRALGSFSIIIDEETVDSLEKRVEGQVLKGVNGKSFNPDGLAFVVARNWAIDKQKKTVTAAKRQVKALLEANRQREERALFERCKKEFGNIYSGLFPWLEGKRPQHLQFVHAVCFLGLSGQELSRMFPGTSVEQRYKWKQRGLEFILPYASTELASYLKRFQRKGA